jgi:predicted GNAT family acetyltransferase
MEVRRWPDAAAFLERAGDWLAEREAEHNLILGLSGGLLRDPALYGSDPVLLTVEESGSICLAGLRTPPFNLVLSEVAGTDAIAEAAVNAIEEALDEPLPGVVGPPAVVRLFAEGRVQRRGGTWEVALSERIFGLRDVIQPSPLASGQLRTASAGDRDVLIRWMLDFYAEALPEPADEDETATAIDQSLAGRGRRFYLWEDGQPVAMSGAGGQTPHGVRIGPVYTPPEHRRRGYASALVAALSQAQLDAGRTFCFLYTDLANPTSNHIYQAIGYEPVADALLVAFSPESEGPPEERAARIGLRR